VNHESSEFHPQRCVSKPSRACQRRGTRRSRNVRAPARTGRGVGGSVEWSGARTEKGKMNATYYLTGAGSSVVENLTVNGTALMTSVYHLDGLDLRMTHSVLRRINHVSGPLDSMTRKAPSNSPLSISPICPHQASRTSRDLRSASWVLSRLLLLSPLSAAESAATSGLSSGGLTRSRSGRCGQRSLFLPESEPHARPLFAQRPQPPCQLRIRRPRPHAPDPGSVSGHRAADIRVFAVDAANSVQLRARGAPDTRGRALLRLLHPSGI
jgi:hypothetical protein